MRCALPSTRNEILKWHALSWMGAISKDKMGTETEVILFYTGPEQRQIQKRQALSWNGALRKEKMGTETAGVFWFLALAKTDPKTTSDLFTLSRVHDQKNSNDKCWVHKCSRGRPFGEDWEIWNVESHGDLKPFWKEHVSNANVCMTSGQLLEERKKSSR